MPTKQPATLGIVLLLGLFSALPSFAQEGPLSLDDVKAMRRERKTYTEIIASMRERGLDFNLDAVAERRLRAMGFSRRLMAEIRELGKEDPAAPPMAAPPAAEAPQAAVEPPPPAKLELEPAAEAAHARLADQVKRMIDESEVPLVHNPSTHITLIANKRIAGRFLGDVARLETALRKKFPEPIASGVDRRAANIAMLETRYEFEKWTRALFKVFEDDGYQFQAEDPVQIALAGQSFFVRGIYSICLEKMTPDEARRRLAFTVGFQYMRQLTRHHAPDGFGTGFGNITEAMMFRQPSIVVKSGYTDRALQGTGSAWFQMVQQRFAQRQIGSIQNVLVYSMNSMEPPEYAEAWSLTELLASDPDKFAKLLTELRKEKEAWTTISETYGVDEDQLLSKWRKFAAARRR